VGLRQVANQTGSSRNWQAEGSARGLARVSKRLRDFKSAEGKGKEREGFKK
jgi:hypothetical protein